MACSDFFAVSAIIVVLLSAIVQLSSCQYVRVVTNGNLNTLDWEAPSNVNPYKEVVFPQLTRHVRTTGRRGTQFVRLVCMAGVHSIIYRMPSALFHSCDLNPAHAKQVGECNGQNALSINFALRNFSIFDGGLVFKNNTSYFFTSFSDGTREGKNQKSGGLCRLGLGLHVKVIYDVDDIVLESERKPTTTTPAVPDTRVMSTAVVAAPWRSLPLVVYSTSASLASDMQIAEENGQQPNLLFAYLKRSDPPPSPLPHPTGTARVRSAWDPVDMSLYEYHRDDEDAIIYRPRSPLCSSSEAAATAFSTALAFVCILVVQWV